MAEVTGRAGGNSGEHRLRFATPTDGDIAGVIAEKLERFRTMDRVMRKADLAQHDGDRFVNQVLTTPDNSPMCTIVSCIEFIPPGGRSNKHGHMNDALFYILSGVGYDVHNGRRADWRAGDVVYVPPGVVHQHFNASTSEPVEALVLNPKLIYLDANLVYQHVLERPYSPPRNEAKRATT